MLFSKADKTSRTFLFTWLALAAVVTLIAIAAYLGAWDSIITGVKTEELLRDPRAQAHVQQMEAQGATQQQIQQQLRRIALSNPNLSAQISGAIRSAKKSSRRAAVIFIISFVLFYMLLARQVMNAKQKRIIIYGFLILILVDQGYVAGKYIHIEDFGRTYARPEAIAKLQDVDKPFRVSVLDRGAYNHWVTLLFPAYDIECIDVPADSRPTPARKMFFYSNAISPLRRWQYGNARFIIASRALLMQMLRGAGERSAFVPFYAYRIGNQEHVVFEYTNALPRVFAVGSWTVKTNADDALEFMNSPAIDPHRVAVVMDETFADCACPDFKGTVTINSYVTEKVDATVVLSSTGMVVMATESDGNWKVLVDGKERRPVQCNLLHQGVLVPPGEHSVVFLYDKRDPTVTLNNMAYLALPVLLVASLGVVIWRAAR